MKALILLLITISISSALDTARVVYTQGGINIDGVLDEGAWEDAKILHDFKFPWGDHCNQQSKARLLWDDSNLYIGVVMSDTGIISLCESGDNINGDDMFELHLGTDPSNPLYFYIMECNLNLIFRSRVRKAKPNGRNDWADTDWKIPDVITKVAINGSKNDTSNIDTSWVIEMKVPFSQVAGWQSTIFAAPSGWSPAVPPVSGSEWRFNLSRHDVNTFEDNLSDWSSFSHNGNYPYTGVDTVHLHDPNNFAVLLFDEPVDLEKHLTGMERNDEIRVSPNPFTSTVNFTLPVQVGASSYTPVKAFIYNASGRCITRLNSANSRFFAWNAVYFPKGIYILKVFAGNKIWCKSIALLD